MVPLKLNDKLTEEKKKVEDEGIRDTKEDLSICEFVFWMYTELCISFLLALFTSDT